jgi:hypothetical protein
MPVTISISRHTHYRRSLPGADFSLEANTEAVPEVGHFYLFQGGRELLRSDDYECAEAAYQQLCRDFWEGRLESGDAGARRSSALGLLGQDPGHPAAAAVLRQDGTAADAARIERARSKKRSEERAATSGRSPARSR